jgi:transposase
MVWMAPPRRHRNVPCWNNQEPTEKKEPSTMDITTLGIDIAKSVFQLHGIDADGAVVVQKKLRRGAVLNFLGNVGPCLIGMEACATSHYWVREIAA